MKILITIVCLSFLTINSSVAAVYKWTDANGKIHFSDRPQIGSAEIKVNSLKPSGLGTTNPQLKRQKELLLQYQNERADKKKVQRNKEIRNNEVAKHCQRLKNRILNYEEADFLFIREDDGSQNRLTDDEIDHEIRVAKKEFAKKCL